MNTLHIQNLIRFSVWNGFGTQRVTAFGFGITTPGNNLHYQGIRSSGVLLSKLGFGFALFPCYSRLTQVIISDIWMLSVNFTAFVADYLLLKSKSACSTKSGCCSGNMLQKERCRWLHANFFMVHLTCDVNTSETLLNINIMLMKHWILIFCAT